MDYESSKQELLAVYNRLYNESAPKWAVKRPTTGEILRPSIPFIGKEYFNQNTRVLLYASAENLTHLDEKNDFKSEAIIVDRHRKTCDKREFFPFIHIGPFNDGPLQVVLLYILTRLQELGMYASSQCNLNEIDPKDLLEIIAVANFGKYSIASGSHNEDYASDKEKLKVSEPFIQADINALQPHIIIVPKAIYEREKQVLKSIGSLVIPIYQINSTVINCTIKSKYKSLPLISISQNVKRWYDQLNDGGITGKTKENFQYVFSHCEEVIKKRIK